MGPEALRIQIRVRPRTKPGWKVVGQDLVLGVSAAPVEGRATDEARHSLAKALDLAPSRITLIRGARSATKLFSVVDLDPLTARLRLADAVGVDPHDLPGF